MTLYLLGNLRVTRACCGRQDDAGTGDESLGTGGASHHVLEEVVLARAQMMRSRLRMWHVANLLRVVSGCILSHPLGVFLRPCTSLVIVEGVSEYTPTLYT